MAYEMSSWGTASCDTTTTTTSYLDWFQNTTAASTIPYSPYTTQYTAPLYYTMPYQYYETPMPAPDPAAVRRHEEELRRRAPLERWRESNRERIHGNIKKEEREASALARRLLMEYLDERNQINFMAEKEIEVESGIHKGVKYLIPKYDGRIKACRGNQVIGELCLQVRAPEWIPEEDKILTKLLYMQHDEAIALRTANRFNMKENLLLPIGLEGGSDAGR